MRRVGGRRSATPVAVRGLVSVRRRAVTCVVLLRIASIGRPVVTPATPASTGPIACSHPAAASGRMRVRRALSVRRRRVVAGGGRSRGWRRRWWRRVRILSRHCWQGHDKRRLGKDEDPGPALTVRVLVLKEMNTGKRRKMKAGRLQ